MNDDEVDRRVGLVGVEVDQLGEAARRGDDEALGRGLLPHVRSSPQNELPDRGHLGGVRWWRGSTDDARLRVAAEGAGGIRRTETRGRGQGGE